MTRVKDLALTMERLAPLSLAESWDNVGLLWGDPHAEVHSVMTCLTVTSSTAQEAIDEAASIIVSHHPILFRPTQKLVKNPGDSNGFLWDLARHNIAIISHHTAYDNSDGGINDQLARLLGLQEVGPLVPAAGVEFVKVVVFVPATDHEAVLSAAFQAGAGRIGNYRECSFATPGTGTFFGQDGTNPTVGQAGRREQVAEYRVELRCRRDETPSVLAAIRSAHSYEEPAIDVYPLADRDFSNGAGRVGTLPAATTLQQLAALARRGLSASGVRFAGEPNQVVERVAICCGAGDSFLSSIRGKADVLVTGEARFHRALEAIELGVGLIAVGHHATERLGVEALAASLRVSHPGLKKVWPSQVERDPWRWSS